MAWSARLAAVLAALLAAACAGAEAADPATTATPVTPETIVTPETTAAPEPVATTVVSSTAPPVLPPPTTAPVASAPPTAPAPRTVSMAFAGDILPHSPLWRRAADNAAAAGRTGFDFDPMLAGLAPLLDGVDLAVCHLETPIAPVGEELSTMPLYGVPAEIADAIAAAGFDRCSTASNHALDRGAAGVDRTVEVLEAAGIEQSGMARTPAEIEPSVFDVDGVALSHLSYTWSYNGLSTPPGEEWRSALIDPIAIVEDARTARALGAELVVVSPHGARRASTSRRSTSATWPRGWRRAIRST